MTPYASSEQLLKYIRQGYMQSRSYETTYYFTTPVIVLAANEIRDGYVLKQELADDITCIGLMGQFTTPVRGPGPIPVYATPYSFNFQVEGTNEWYFSQEIDARMMFSPFFPTLLPAMPYEFVRPFVVHSNSAIVLNMTNLTANQNSIQFCFISIRSIGNSGRVQ